MTAGGYDPNQYPPPNDPNQYPGQYPSNNPYGSMPPAPSGGPYGYGPQPGDVGIRFVARLIDNIILSIVLVPFLIIIGFPGSLGASLLFGVVSAVLSVAYFVFMETTYGWTLGKKLLHLNVRGANGAPKPDPRESFIRNSWMLLSVVPYLGSLAQLAAAIVIAVTINSSPTKQGKHDELAGGTQVLKD